MKIIMTNLLKLIQPCKIMLTVNEFYYNIEENLHCFLHVVQCHLMFLLLKTLTDILNSICPDNRL